jgi:O-acetylserine/cysteine efflux transporter
VLLGAWLLGDSLGINKLAGGGLVLAGLALITLRFGPRRPAP